MKSNENSVANKDTALYCYEENAL